MPKGRETQGPRSLENIGRETITNLFLEVLGLTRSTSPRCWELAGLKLDEAADVARRVEIHLDRHASVEAGDNELDAFLASLPASHPLQAPKAEAPRAVHFPFPGSATGASFPNPLKVGGRR